MKLDQALTINVRLVCNKCEGHQPGYILQLIEEHGPNADLKETLKIVPCMWCKKMGGLLIAPWVGKNPHFNSASIADSNSTHAFRSVIARMVKENSRANWNALSRFLLHLSSRFIFLVDCLMVPTVGFWSRNKPIPRICSYYVL